MDVKYTGNEAKAICKIAKKYKMPCYIADQLTITPDFVQFIVNPRRTGNAGIAADSKQLSSLVKTGKTEYNVKIENDYIEINGISIPTISTDNHINQSSWINYERIMTTLEKDMNGIRIDNEIMIPVEQFKAFCGTLDNSEGIRICLIGQTAIFTGCSHENNRMTINIPYRPEDANEIVCHLGNEYVKKWVSLASANTKMKMRIESDHPVLMEIMVNGCWFDTILAPRFENE